MNDPERVLERLRKICLALPDTSEVIAWGTQTSRWPEKHLPSLRSTKESGQSPSRPKENISNSSSTQTSGSTYHLTQASMAGC